MIGGECFLKKIYFILLSLTFVLLMTGCGLKAKSLTEFYEKDLAGVSKIVCFSSGINFISFISSRNEFIFCLSVTVLS